MANNTDQFFELVEQTFSVDEITAEKIMEKFYRGTFGNVSGGKGRKRRKSKATIEGQSLFRGLAERLSEGRELSKEIEGVEDFNELKELKNRAEGLEIHSKVVVSRADERLNILGDELEKLKEGRKEKRLEEERNEKIIASAEQKLDKINNKIEDATSISQLDRFESQVLDIESKGVDVGLTGEALSLIRGMRRSVEATLEQESEERVIRAEEKRLNRQAQLREIEETGGGINPDF